MTSYFRKMKLVPVDHIDSRTHVTPIRRTDPTLDKAAHLNKQMNSLLTKAEKPSHVMAKQFNNLLSQYLHNYKLPPIIQRSLPTPKVTSQAETPEKAPPEAAVTFASPSQIQSDIQTLPTTSQPAKRQKKAITSVSSDRLETIIKRISNANDILTWNEDGELIFHGRLIPDTNIYDIIAAKTTHSTTEPPGTLVFDSVMDIVQDREEQNSRNQQLEQTLAGTRSPKRRRRIRQKWQRI